MNSENSSRSGRARLEVGGGAVECRSSPPKSTRVPVYELAGVKPEEFQFQRAQHSSFQQQLIAKEGFFL